MREGAEREHRAARKVTRCAGVALSHPRWGPTHQEFLQIFVVGDDAVVDDNELWRQKKALLSSTQHPQSYSQ